MPLNGQLKSKGTQCKEFGFMERIKQMLMPLSAQGSEQELGLRATWKML